MDGSAVVWQLGPIGITAPVLTSWAVMLVLAAVCGAARRGAALAPGPLQVLLEGIVTAAEDAIRAVLPEHVAEVLPFVGTLWIYIGVANLAGIVPGLHSPTADLSTTLALAIVVFLSVHVYGVRTQGWRRYLRHYLSPTPILLPFHLLSELSRTLALAVRLFGNIMSLELAALLVLLVGGLFLPIPLLLLHILEALVQAYIFGILALIYIAGAIQSQSILPPTKD